MKVLKIYLSLAPKVLSSYHLMVATMHLVNIYRYRNTVSCYTRAKHCSTFVSIEKKSIPPNLTPEIVYIQFMWLLA